MVPVFTTTAMNQLIQAFAAYLTEVKMRSPTTITRYVDVMVELTTFLEHTVGPTFTLETLEKRVMVDFLRQGTRSTGEASRPLWNSRLAALRSFFAFLFTTEVVKDNPAMRIERLKESPKEAVPLSLDEFLSLIDALETSPQAYRSRNVLLAQVLYHCALRVSEVLSLNLAQLDFNNYLFQNAKTKGRKWLSVPFNDLVASALERYLTDRSSLGIPPSETALFLSDRRQRMSVRSVQEMIKTYAEHAGITGRSITPHLLRHSAVTELADLGTPLPVIQSICNHASITTTQRYIHLKGTARRSAIDLLGEVVSRRAEERKRTKDEAPS